MGKGWHVLTVSLHYCNTTQCRTAKSELWINNVQDFYAKKCACFSAVFNNKKCNILNPSNCVTSSPLLLIMSLVVLSFKVYMWLSNQWHLTRSPLFQNIKAWFKERQCNQPIKCDVFHFTCCWCYLGAQLASAVQLFAFNLDHPRLPTSFPFVAICDK